MYWRSVACLLAVSAAPCAAQVLYGSLTGTVTDTGGSVVPRAAVKLVNTGTSQQLTGTTNEAGSYSFSSVLPGAYDLTINAPGFRTLTRRDIGISVNVVRREDVTLEVGQVTE